MNMQGSGTHCLSQASLLSSHALGTAFWMSNVRTLHTCLDLLLSNSSSISLPQRKQSVLKSNCRFVKLSRGRSSRGVSVPAWLASSSDLLAFLMLLGRQKLRLHSLCTKSPNLKTILSPLSSLARFTPSTPLLVSSIPSSLTISLHIAQQIDASISFHLQKHEYESLNASVF